MTLELEPRLAPPVRNGSVVTNGSIGRLLPGVEAPVSSYVQYLPAPYQLDPFVGRFLLIFESILGPIEQTIDTVANYFDPRVAPPELLPWLASWVGIELDEHWPLERRRQLILWAARLYRLRGTRRGLREHLRLYTGRTPLIVENFDGVRLGEDAMLGVSTQIGSDSPRAHALRVTVFADPSDSVDERIVRQIIELQKPAHVAYTFEIRAPGGEPV
jgi:phage tail-like protein